ncbi:hypothetical protein PDIDSM_5313 [Penicillium digitatum]|nr:hypothetical protein PDIDSM_5306 [Penicillium digitatum]KAG0157810.1 hypothetical protein PDIDSM_1833 [Penicillium digitatum]KAG0157819.1 hypothetical protein PDIDSM_5313 [Penicillium digitatum]
MRLQTNFDDHQDGGDPISNFENDGNFDTNRELEGKQPRGGLGPRYTLEEESEVVRRFDRRLVPFLALLYLLSFLDRSNIGNAKIAGLKDDLQLSSSQYEGLLTAFYITYILRMDDADVPRCSPIFISLYVYVDGLVASFQCLATSFGGLVVLRALLGITEAAFGPGVPFYLSLFYRRHELAFRNGLFISAAPLATSFASSLAYLIVRFSSDGPISPWRTLFLVEGFQVVVAQQRLEESTSDYRQSYRSRFNWREIWKTASDPKAYMAAFMFFSCNVAFSSMPVFLPTIIKDPSPLSTSLSRRICGGPAYRIRVRPQPLQKPIFDSPRPYLITRLLRDRSNGLLPLTPVPWLHTFIRYMCVYPATAGFFSAITLIITWSMDNRVEKEGKGASIAILNIIGQCGPLLGTRLYPETDGPWYIRGMATCSFFMVVVAGWQWDCGSFYGG